MRRPSRPSLALAERRRAEEIRRSQVKAVGAARRVAAGVGAGGSPHVPRAAVAQRRMGLVARVPALWPPARHAGDLPARPLQLRGLLAPLLGVRRGLLCGPWDG